jgi:hypothetical protein
MTAKPDVKTDVRLRKSRRVIEVFIWIGLPLFEAIVKALLGLLSAGATCEPKRLNKPVIALLSYRVLLAR